MKFQKKLIADNILYIVEGDLSVTNFFVVDKLCVDIRNSSKIGGYNFIWDLSKTNLVDSTGLSVIAITIASAMRDGKKVKLCGVNPDNARLLRISKMGSNIEQYNHLDEALDTVANGLPTQTMELELINEVC